MTTPTLDRNLLADLFPHPRRPRFGTDLSARALAAAARVEALGGTFAKEGRRWTIAGVEDGVEGVFETLDEVEAEIADLEATALARAAGKLEERLAEEVLSSLESYAASVRAQVPVTVEVSTGGPDEPASIVVLVRTTAQGATAAEALAIVEQGARGAATRRGFVRVEREAVEGGYRLALRLGDLLPSRDGTARPYEREEVREEVERDLGRPLVLFVAGATGTKITDEGLAFSKLDDALSATAALNFEDAARHARDGLRYVEAIGAGDAEAVLRGRLERARDAAVAAAEPVVGAAATFVLYTDRTAATVVAVRKNGKEVVLRADAAVLLNGFQSGEPDALTFSPGGFCGHTSGTQRHVYVANPEGEEIVVSRRVAKDGSVRWKRVGSSSTSPGSYAYFGRRSAFYDFNF